MTLSQQLLTNRAYKAGACKVYATAMHGWARFTSDDNAREFAEQLLGMQWSVTRYKQDAVTQTLSCVDWQLPRLMNGQHKRDGVMSN